MARGLNRPCRYGEYEATRRTAALCLLFLTWTLIIACSPQAATRPSSSETTSTASLQEAADEAIQAARLGLRNGIVDYTLTARLAETLGKTGDRDRLHQIFKELLATDSSSTVYLDYAIGLSLAGEEAEAENAFRQAARSDSNGEATAQYGEWLLDRNRDEDALKVLPEETPIYYISFLRGVVLERLGRATDAQEEYTRFREYSRTFPAPARFRIAGSTAQSGILFEQKP